MATKNMLTDSTKKDKQEYQKRMEKSRKRLQVAHLNSTAGKNEQIARKDPTVAAAKKRSKTAALASKNMSGRYPNSIEYGDQDARYESQSVRHPKEWKRANFGKNRDLGTANANASRAAGSRPVAESKRRIAKAANSIPGLGAMLPKSTGPAKKSTSVRKKSK